MLTEGVLIQLFNIVAIIDIVGLWLPLAYQISSTNNLDQSVVILNGFYFHF